MPNDDKIILLEQLGTYHEGLKGIFQEQEAGKGLSSNDYTTTEKTKLAGIDENANAYTLPTASGQVLGGVKVGEHLEIDNNGALSGAYSGATQNASGLMSAADKTKLDGFDTATTYATKTYVQQQVEEAGHLKRVKVLTLPSIAEADLNTIYMVPKSTAQTGNGFNEYMVIDGAWEKIGDTETTLVYATDADIQTILNS